MALPTPQPFHWQQADFAGGINLLDDATKIADNQYPLLRNGRNRNNKITPIREHVEVNNIPAGKKQGCYAAGSILVVFVAGRAYYKDYNTADLWRSVAGLQMDATVDRIHAVLVDASTVNFKRVLPGTPKNTNINLTTLINGSPKCMVVQDGINQPWVIMADGSARVTQTYAQWTDASREYVPKGTIMFYSGAVLYIAGPNGAIFRSVTGRPLDFMVNITTTGDKGGATEEQGGAQTVAHRVDFDEITAFSQVSVTPGAQGGFMVSTINNSYLVIPNYTNLIFGEPTFQNVWLFSTGPVNNYCSTGTTQDFVFIDRNNIWSFNSVQQLVVDANNSIFSRPVATLLESSPDNPIYQTVTAATSFNSYLHLALNTYYGAAVLLYDALAERFVSVDQQEGVGLVKQYATIKTATSLLLFFITQDDKLWQAYAGDTATVSIYLGEWSSAEPQVNQQLKFFRAVFSDAMESGEATLTPYTDRRAGLTMTQAIQTTYTPTVPAPFPFPTYTRQGVQPLTFTITGPPVGWKVGFLLSWNCRADLTFLSIDSDANTLSQGPYQAAMNSGSAIIPT